MFLEFPGKMLNFISRQVSAARGVDLKKFSGEMDSFKIPSFISARVMKRLFKKNVQVRQITELHNNSEDLPEICADVYHSVLEYSISAPRFKAMSKYFQKSRN